MTINYIIVAHRNPRQFQRLVNRLNSEDVFFYVHIDKSVDDHPFKNKLTHLTNIFFLEDKERVITAWSNISFSRAILALLTKCCEKVQKDAYCVLLSGQDYPLRSNHDIYSFFRSNYGTNYISIENVVDIWPRWKDRLERYNFHLPGERLDRGLYPIVDSRCYSLRNAKDFIFLARRFGVKTPVRTLFKGKRKSLCYPEPKGGSTWYALPVETVVEILGHLTKHPELLKYHSFSHVPDEILFHSLINGLKPSNEIKESTTYVNWSRKNVQLPVTFELSDLNDLLQLDKRYLFARKFDEAIDSDILDQLDAKSTNENM